MPRKARVDLSLEGAETLLNLSIAPVYGALLAILFLILSVRTLLLRRKFQVAVGDGGNIVLKRAGRAHANFSEYVPLALLLLCFCELLAAPLFLLNGMGISLVVGRCLHAYGISQPEEDFRLRVSGVALTLSTMTLSLGYILFQWFTRLTIAV